MTEEAAEEWAEEEEENDYQPPAPTLTPTLAERLILTAFDELEEDELDIDEMYSNDDSLRETCTTIERFVQLIKQISECSPNGGEPKVHYEEEEGGKGCRVVQDIRRAAP